MELMVATTVVAIMMLAVYQAYVTSVGAWHRQEAELASLEHGRGLLATLEAELRCAQPVFLPKSEQSFVAGPNHLSFFTRHSLLDGSDWGDLTRLTYDRVPSPDGRVSVRRISQAYSGGEPMGKPVESVVLAGARQVRLEYLAVKATAVSPLWQETWDVQGDIPRAARASVVLEAAGAKFGTSVIHLTATTAITARPEPKQP